MKTGISLALCSFLCVVSAGPASPAYVYWADNGHWYEARHRPDGIDWQTAQDECAAEGGYLVTLTSSEENAFAFSLVSSDSSLWFIDGANNGQGPWLGGLQPPGSPEPGGNWQWVTGELWDYTHWAPGEPNNAGAVGDEDRLQFFMPGGLIGDYWNDVNGGGLKLSYIFESNHPPTAVEDWSLMDVSWTRIKALWRR